MSKLVQTRNFVTQRFSGFPAHLLSSNSKDPYYSRGQEFLKEKANEKKNSRSRASLLKTMYNLHIKRKDGKLFIPTKEELMSADEQLCKTLIRLCGSARSKRYTFVITKLKAQYSEELKGLTFSDIGYNAGFTPKKV